MEAANIPAPQLKLPRTELLIMAATALAVLYLYRRFLDQSLAAQERAHQEANATLRAQADPAVQAAIRARAEAIRRARQEPGVVVPITTANGHHEPAFHEVRDTEVMSGGQHGVMPEEPDFDTTRPIAPDTPGPVGDGGDAA